MTQGMKPFNGWLQYVTRRTLKLAKKPRGNPCDYFQIKPILTLQNRGLVLVHRYKFIMWSIF